MMRSDYGAVDHVGSCIAPGQRLEHRIEHAGRHPSPVWSPSQRASSAVCTWHPLLWTASAFTSAQFMNGLLFGRCTGLSPFGHDRIAANYLIRDAPKSSWHLIGRLLTASLKRDFFGSIHKASKIEHCERCHIRT